MRTKPREVEERDQIKKQDKKTVREFSLESKDGGESVDTGWQRFDRMRKTQKTQQQSLE